MMKRNVLTMVLSIAMLSMSALQARSEDDDRGCSNDSLTGSYGFLVTGTIIGVGPLGIAGVANYDGAGNWSRQETAVVNGHVLPPEIIAGTYIVNSDCTGSTADVQGHHSSFVLVNHRKEILGVGTDNGSVTTVSSKKQ